MNRNLVFGVCTFALCGLLSFVLPKQLTILLLLLSSLIFIISTITAKLSHRFSKVLLCSFFAIISFILSLSIHLPNAEKTAKYTEYYENITAEVLTITENPFYTSAVVKTRKIENENVSVKILVSDFCSNGIKEGDIVTIAGKISNTFSNNWNFNAQNYNAARKIFLKMNADLVAKADASPNVLRNALYDFRAKCFEFTDGLENSSLIRALTIGDKTKLSAELKSDFESLGLSHALAVSGMHLSLLVMSLYVFLHNQNVNKKLLSIICSVCVLFYMALTGFSFSIIRAGIMMIVYFLSLLSRRQNDSITSLFASLLFILIENPLSVFDVGLQLSFTSTLGILVFASPAISKISNRMFTKKPKIKVLKYHVINTAKKVFLTIIATLFSTIAATLFSLPLLCIYFRSFTLFSIISNITVIFLINYLLIFSIIHIILSFIFSNSFPFVLTPTKTLCNFLSNSVIKSCAFLVDILPSPFRLTSEISLVIASVCAVVTIVFLFLTKSFKNFLLYALIVFFFIVFLVFSEKYLLFKNPIVTSSVSKNCTDTVIEDGAYSILISNDSDKAKSSALFEILDLRAVERIDKAVFFITDEIPHEKIERILSHCEVEEFVFAPVTTTALLYYREDIFKNSKIAVCYNPNFQISENSNAHVSSDDNYSICVGNNNEIIITWRLDKTSVILPHKDTAKAIVVLNECEFLTPSDSVSFYYSNTNTFAPFENTRFIQLRTNDKKITARTYE